MPRLAYQTTLSEMQMIGAKEGTDFTLSVAGGVPEMVTEAWDIEALSDEELLELARRERVDLRKYEP